MIGLNGSSTGDGRHTGLRDRGVAEAKASRTMRRCVENRRANSRTDTSGSNRRALRICSNNSTFDLFAINPTVHEQEAVAVDTCHPGGAKTDEHNPLKWGQNR
jgi:hypothetical protein